VHACTKATNAVHALVVGAPEQVRDRLRGLSTAMLLRRCAAMKVMAGWPVDVRATVTALRSAARRAIALDAEANELQRAIVNEVAPELIAERGVGPITGAVVFRAWSRPGATATRPRSHRSLVPRRSRALPVESSRSIGN
jgi:transposase